MLGFVETPRERPEESGFGKSKPPLWTLIFMGCLLINTVVVSFIPMSQISGLDVSVLFLVLVVLPLLFLSIFLAGKFGYGILFAAFLSIPGGIASVIVMGDFFSLLSGRNIIQDIQVREAPYYPLAKIFTFKNPRLLHNQGLDTAYSQMVSGRAGGGNHLPAVTHSLVPIVDSDFRKGDDISAFALCTHNSKDRKDCTFRVSGIHGGIQVPDPVRKTALEILKSHRDDYQLPIQSSPIFLYWIPQPRERILLAGYYGLGFIVFLNILWVLSVYFYYTLQKKS